MKKILSLFLAASLLSSCGTTDYEDSSNTNKDSAVLPAQNLPTQIGAPESPPASNVPSQAGKDAMAVHDPVVAASLEKMRHQYQLRTTAIGTFLGGGLGFGIYLLTLLHLKHYKSIARTNPGKFSVKRGGKYFLLGGACGLVLSSIAAYTIPEPKMSVIPPQAQKNAAPLKMIQPFSAGSIADGSDPKDIFSSQTPAIPIYRKEDDSSAKPLTESP